MYSDSYPVHSIADAAPSKRAEFVRKTYFHLALAILAFLGLEAVLLQLPISAQLTQKILSMPFGWIMVLGGFMVVGWIAQAFAVKSTSKPAQYFGLGLYVVAEAIIFVPLLLIAAAYAGPGIFVQAALITGLLFAGLTATAFITRKDFSFLGPILMIGGFVAIGIIVAGAIFGFNLGLLFSGAMLLFAGGAILYTTSNIIHHYGEDQHVAAALELFAAVALLFWYVIRILMAARD